MANYWSGVKQRWSGMVEGKWDKVVEFQSEPSPQRQRMQHNHHSEMVNRKVLLHEGEWKSWSFSFKATTPLMLALQRTDGPDMTIYIASDSEYCNFEQGRQFYPEIKLNYDEHLRFSLPYGKYYLIAYLPRYRDGYKSRAEALLRLDVLL